MTAPHDCGHACCDERSDPHHDHFLTPDVCPACAAVPAGQLVATSDDPGRPFTELMDSGLLWLINASVFHPRGLALAIALDPEGNAAGWSLLAADAGEAYRYAVPCELDDPTKAVDVDDLFRRATATMEQARLTAWGA